MGKSDLVKEALSSCNLLEKYAQGFSELGVDDGVFKEWLEHPLLLEQLRGIISSSDDRQSFVSAFKNAVAKPITEDNLTAASATLEESRLSPSPQRRPQGSFKLPRVVPKPIPRDSRSPSPRTEDSSKDPDPESDPAALPIFELKLESDSNRSATTEQPNLGDVEQGPVQTKQSRNQDLVQQCVEKYSEEMKIRLGKEDFNEAHERACESASKLFKETWSTFDPVDEDDKAAVFGELIDRIYLLFEEFDQKRGSSSSRTSNQQKLSVIPNQPDPPKPTVVSDDLGKESCSTDISIFVNKYRKKMTNLTADKYVIPIMFQNYHQEARSKCVDKFTRKWHHISSDPNSGFLQCLAQLQTAIEHERPAMQSMVDQQNSQVLLKLEQAVNDALSFYKDKMGLVLYAAEERQQRLHISQKLYAETELSTQIDRILGLTSRNANRGDKIFDEIKKSYIFDASVKINNYFQSILSSFNQPDQQSREGAASPNQQMVNVVGELGSRIESDQQKEQNNVLSYLDNVLED